MYRLLNEVEVGMQFITSIHAKGNKLVPDSVSDLHNMGVYRKQHMDLWGQAECHFMDLCTSKDACNQGQEPGLYHAVSGVGSDYSMKCRYSCLLYMSHWWFWNGPQMKPLLWEFMSMCCYTYLCEEHKDVPIPCCLASLPAIPGFTGPPLKGKYSHNVQNVLHLDQLHA